MSLVDSVSGSASFYRKLFYAFFQLGFNELKEFIRAHIRLGILGDIRTDGQRNIPKLVNKAKIEPGPKGAALSGKRIKGFLTHAKVLTIELCEVIHNVVALHDALEAGLPFALEVLFLNGPGMIVEAAPFTAVFPPVIFLPGGNLVRRQFLENLSGLNTPISVFKRTEDGPDDIHLRIVVVVRTHLIVQVFRQIRARGKHARADDGQ